MIFGDMNEDLFLYRPILKIRNEILRAIFYTLLIKDGDDYYGKDCSLY